MPRHLRRNKKKKPRRENLPAPQAPLPGSPPSAGPLVSRQEFHFAEYRGLLPPPSHLKQYEEIHPGITAVLLDIAKRRSEATIRQSDHRQSLERDHLNRSSKSRTVGQWMAFALTLFALWIAFNLVKAGQPLWAFAATISSLGGLAAVFIFARIREDRARDRNFDRIMKQAK